MTKESEFQETLKMTNTTKKEIVIHLVILGILFYLFYIFRFFTDFPTDVAEFLDVENDVRAFWAVDEDDPYLAKLTRYPRHLYYYPLYFPVKHFFNLLTGYFLSEFQSLLLMHVLMGLALTASSYLVTYRITLSRQTAFFTTAFTIISIPEFLSIRGFPTCIPDAMAWAFVPSAFILLYELGKEYQPSKLVIKRIVGLGLVTSLMFLSSYHVISIFPAIVVIIVLWLILGRIKVFHLIVLVLTIAVSNLLVSFAIYGLRWVVTSDGPYVFETGYIFNSAFLQGAFSYVGHVADPASYKMLKFLEWDHITFRLAKLFEGMELHPFFPFIQIPGSPYYSYAILPLLAIGLLDGVWKNKRSLILVAVGFLTLIIANNFSPRNGLWSYHLSFFSFPLYLGAGQGLFAIRQIFVFNKIKGLWWLVVALFLGGATIQNYAILQIKMYRNHSMIGDGWQALLKDYFEYVENDKTKPLMLIHSFWRRVAFDFYNKKAPPNYQYWADYILINSFEKIIHRMNEILKEEKEKGQNFILFSNSSQFIDVENAHDFYESFLLKKWLVKEHASPRNSERILWELYKIPTSEVFDISKFSKTNIDSGKISDLVLRPKFGFQSHSFRVSPISLLSASHPVKFKRVENDPAPGEGGKVKKVLEIVNQGENRGFFWFDSTIPPEKIGTLDIFEVTFELSSETASDLTVLNWRTIKGIDIKLTPEKKKYSFVVRIEANGGSAQMVQNRFKVEFHVPGKSRITFHDFSINRYNLAGE
jgi:hypothetical protein